MPVLADTELNNQWEPETSKQEVNLNSYSAYSAVILCFLLYSSELFDDVKQDIKRNLS